MSIEPSKASKSPAGSKPASTARRAAPGPATRRDAEAKATDAEAAAAEAGAAAEVALPLPSWVRRLAALAAIAVGWGFIAWHNHFYFTPPVVILALGWGASVSTLYFLWRVGAAGADTEAAREDWWLYGGEREELEREKRALLKTIREIEFDHQTGKLSSHDAQEMTQVVRVRAIEVMKALDALEDGAGGARAEIEREVRARLEIEKARKAGKKAKGVVSKDAVAKAVATLKAEEARKASAKAEPKTEPTPKAEVADAKAEVVDAKAEVADAKAEVADEKPAGGGRSATAINVSAAAELGEARPLDDAGDGDAGAASGDRAADEAASSPSSSSTERKSSEVSA